MDSDWDLGEGLDPEGPSGSDLDRFGDELTICRRCGGSMYDQAYICPHCGELVVESKKTLSVWYTIGILFLVVLFLIVVW